MADMEYRGDSTAVSEITDAVLEQYIPGGRYGLRLYNKQLIEAIGPRLNTTINTADLALKDVQEQLIAAAGAQSVRAESIDKRGKRAIRIESIAGESLGARVRATPACYTVNQRQGINSTAQVFRIILPKGATGGTWTLTFKDSTYPDVLTETTTGLNHNASESTVATALQDAANNVPVIATSLTGVTVTLVNPGTATESRVYEVTMGGGFSGMNFLVAAEGGALQGTATVTCAPLQLAAASATAIQTVSIPLMLNPVNGRQQVVKFSRGGVTSAEVSCELASPQPENFKAAVDAALATVLGENKVQTKIATNELTTPGVSYRGRGIIVIAILWNDLGTQAPIASVYYSKQKNAYPGVNSPLSGQTRVIRESGANQNEFLLANVDQGGQPQNYQITQGATTWTVNHDYTTTQAELVTEWEEGVGAGNVGITFLDSELCIYMVEFKGAKSNLNQALPTFTTPSGRTFQVVSEGQPLQNQIDQVIIRADGGTFTASSNGTNFTSGLAWNLSAATFQTALRGLAAIGSGNCTVTGTGSSSDPFLVEYIGGKAATFMPQLKFGVGSLLGGYDPEIFIVSTAILGVSQITQIWLDPNLNGGYLIPLVNGVFDTRVAYNANAATWESAIESIPSSGCAVTGSGQPFIVTFDGLGPKELTLNQDQATVSVSSLITLENVQTATGPAFWNEPLNWSGGVVPGSGDRAILRDGSVNIREGLNQRCKFTVDLTTGNLIMGTDITDVGHFVPGQMVYLSTTGTLPTATSGGSGITLSNATGYYVTAVSQWSRRLQLSTTLGGQAIEFTGNGTGVHTVEVYLLEYQQHAKFSGTVGLARRINGRLEERPRWLSAGSALEQYGIGDAGSGSELQNRDLGTRVCVVKQFSTGSMGGDGDYSVNVRASNTGTNFWTGSGNLAISPTDMGTDKSIVGTIEANNSQILLGKVEIGGFQGMNTQLESPYGFTMRSNCTFVNKK